MEGKLTSIRLIVLALLVTNCVSGQVVMPSVPTVSNFEVITPAHYSNAPAYTPSNIFSTRPENGMEMYEQDRKLVEQQEQQLREIYAEMQSNNINYSLPSLGNKQGTQYYREVFENLNRADINKVSVKDLNFQIENAFYENQKDKAEFDGIIKNIGEFITAKMKELEYDPDSNSAKNFMLFQFFSDTLTLKNGTQHLPFTYDFEDYMGIQDHSKMFISKLLETQTGQCHSLPLLYLILAEEIGAEAFLAYSPNHSYIRFQADNKKWFNIELTNGMFSTTSYILQSGFIKSEALQNKIYMHNLSQTELLSQLYTDLANGYIHKFGYDEFVSAIINKALELSPNNIGANMVKANLDTTRFMYVMNQLGIDPNEKEELQSIRHFPQAVTLLNEVNSQYDVIDDLGYSHMPAEAYQKWLQSMKEQKNEQENQIITEQFKGLMNKPQPQN